MDLSQLPKMSETPKPAPVAPPTPSESPRRPVDYGIAPVPTSMGGVAVLISLIVGVIFLWLGTTFFHWAVASAAGRDFPTGYFEDDGTPRTYFHLSGGTAWSEAGYFSMGVALLLDAVLLGLIHVGRGPRRPLASMAIALTSVALLINVAAAIYVFTFGILPLASLIAVLTGGIMLFDQMALLRESR